VPLSDFIRFDPDGTGNNIITKNVTFFGGGLSPGDTTNIGGSFYIIDTVTGDSIKVFDLWDKDQITNLTDLTDLSAVDTSQKSYNTVPGSPVILDSDKDGLFDWAYVGDNEGRIWKINFHDPDPAYWTQCLFYDLADTDVSGSLADPTDDPTRRQPIWYSPILVNGPNEMLLVYFSTGHIETSDVTQGAADTYFLYGLEDRQPVDALGCQYASPIPTTLTGETVRWPKAFQPGERLIGSPTVTQSLIIFQTWAPFADVPCAVGEMRLWILDYLTNLPVWNFGQGVEPYISMSNTGLYAMDENANIWTECLSDDCKGQIVGQTSLGSPPPYPMSWGEGIELPF
jgi:hypothetical protein